MKIIAFTICTNNHISQACAMLKSWKKYHPEVTTKIILVDAIYTEEELYELLGDTEVIPVARLDISGFDDLVLKYNIYELTVAIRPDSMIYLFQNHNADSVIYIDTDIMFTGRCSELFHKLETYDIVLTPHMIMPIDDGFYPSDVDILKGGVFNMGFAAFAHFNSVKGFLQWWKERLHKYAYVDFTKNLFGDQLWMDFLPCYFDNYYILKHLGYNVANWNLHERNVTLDNESYWVNEKFEMKFFHFSGFRYNTPGTLCWYCSRYKLEDFNALKALFKSYYDNLKEANYEKYSHISSVYIPIYKSYQEKKAKELYNSLPLKIKMARKLVSIGRKFIYGKSKS